MVNGLLNRAIDGLAGRQFGLVTGSQLAELGLDRPRIQFLVHQNRLLRVRRGVYRVCGVAPTWYSTVLAGVLAAGAGAVASHRTAAAVWGLLDRSQLDGPIDVALPGQRRLDGLRAHRMLLDPGEVTVHRRIPVTTVARTLMDLASSIDAVDLGRLCDEAQRRRLLHLGALEAVVRGHAGPGRRRLAPIHQVLADRVPGYDPGANDWEREMDRQWDQMGLPPAVRQHRIRIGRRTFIIDRAIVELKIAVEWNGFSAHGTRAAFDRDSDRRALLAAAGWFPLDYTSRSDPGLICRSVRAVVEQRTMAAG